jgi:hypothetical protein
MTRISSLKGVIFIVKFDNVYSWPRQVPHKHYGLRDCWQGKFCLLLNNEFFLLDIWYHLYHSSHSSNSRHPDSLATPDHGRTAWGVQRERGWLQAARPAGGPLLKRLQRGGAWQARVIL